MRLSFIAFALFALPACGYSTSAARGDGEPRAIAMAPVVEPGLHVDTGAVVDRAVRKAIATSAGVRLVRDEAEATFIVELVRSGAGLEAFAEPGLRAGQYQAAVELKGRLVAPNGKTMWASPVVIGEAPFLSTPGPLEALDGAERRSLASAAERAAERLVGLLLAHLHAS